MEKTEHRFYIIELDQYLKQKSALHVRLLWQWKGKPRLGIIMEAEQRDISDSGIDVI